MRHLYTELMEGVEVMEQDRIDCDDHLRGQRDCMKGIPHKEGVSESYTRGYRSRYEFEQVQNELEAKHGTK